MKIKINCTENDVKKCILNKAKEKAKRDVNFYRENEKMSKLSLVLGICAFVVFSIMIALGMQDIKSLSRILFVAWALSFGCLGLLFILNFVQDLKEKNKYIKYLQFIENCSFEDCMKHPDTSDTIREMNNFYKHALNLAKNETKLIEVEKNKKETALYAFSFDTNLCYFLTDKELEGLHVFATNNELKGPLFIPQYGEIVEETENESELVLNCDLTVTYKKKKEV